MTMTDPIADMLTRVRNGFRASHETVDIPYSKLKAAIGRILKAEGYIKNCRVIAEGDLKVLRVHLKYDQGKTSVISGLKRVSRPGRRMYKGYDDIPHVLNGFGISIVSTSKGVMTDREAKKLHVGGEVLCSVW